jgi:uncharacterized protein
VRVLGRDHRLILPAATRYSGVVWEHLDPSTLGPEHLERVIVPTALLGATLATDPVPDHRLTFTASRAGLGRLDRWWRPELTKALVEHVAGRTVVEMLPGEHLAALDLAVLEERVEVVRVRFAAATRAAAVGLSSACRGSDRRRRPLE